MAQHNFENKMKEQLQQREITPSARSWDRLEAKLDAQNNKKSNKNWWLGIAAAVAVGIFIGASVFNFENNETQIQVVEISSEENKAEENKETQIASEEIEIYTETEAKTENSAPAEAILEEKKLLPKKTSQKTFFKNENSQVAEHKEEKELVLPEAEPKIQEADAVAELLAQQTQKNTAADEAEMLLNDAKRKIFLESAMKEQNSIAAKNLLQDVEADLQQSFRNQVFDALKEGFSKVKTAVADRNF